MGEVSAVDDDPDQFVGAFDYFEPQLNRSGEWLLVGRTADRIPGHDANHFERIELGPDHTSTVVTTLRMDPPPRAGRGLGGGSWCFAADEGSTFYAAGDGNIYEAPLLATEEPNVGRRVTRVTNGQTAWSPCVSSDGAWLVCEIDQAEMWAFDLAAGGRAVRIDPGTADFVLDPVIDSAEDSNGWVVTWQAWDVPNMPWDQAYLQQASLSTDGVQHVEPDVVPSTAIQQPRPWNGSMLSVRDDDGWLNVWRDNAPLVAEPFEHAGPTLGPGQRSFVGSPDGHHVAFTRNERGFGRLCVVDTRTGAISEVGKGVHGQLSWRGARLAALRTGATTPPQLVVYDTTTWARTVVGRTVAAATAVSERLVEPTVVTIPTTTNISNENAWIDARWYAATARARGALVWVHGGPTGQWQVSFHAHIALWRARGWHVIVPDHRGSTGHGRSFQQALRHRWGELDRDDIADCVHWVHDHGLATPASTVVIGSSAGGFTALNVAAHHPHLIAGIVASYPVTDLADLAINSHRFERHYNDTLVGPPSDPATAVKLHERSPLHRAAQLTTRPMLIFHGDADPVVPVSQSVRLVDEVRRLGGDATLTVFAGEGHGFRQLPNQRREDELIRSFLDRVVDTTE